MRYPRQKFSFQQYVTNQINGIHGRVVPLVVLESWSTRYQPSTGAIHTDAVPTGEIPWKSAILVIDFNEKQKRKRKIRLYMAHNLMGMGRMEHLDYSMVCIYELMSAPTVMPTPPRIKPE